MCRLKVGFQSRVLNLSVNTVYVIISFFESSVDNWSKDILKLNIDSKDCSFKYINK